MTAPRKPVKKKPRGRVTPADAADLDAVRRELELAVDKSELPRWRVDPDDARRSVARLVLALVDFLRQLLERQAIRRMEQGTLDAAQVESVGRALMELERTVVEMARAFGLDPRDLNLDLGPLGRLK